MSWEESWEELVVGEVGGEGPYEVWEGGVFG